MNSALKALFLSPVLVWSCGSPAAAQDAGATPPAGPAEVDVGTSSVTAQAATILVDIDSKYGVSTAFARLMDREGAIRRDVADGLLDPDEAARELYELGQAFRAQRRREDSFRVYEQVFDYSPNSFVAAKAWLEIGRMQLQSGTPANALDPLLSAEKVLTALTTEGLTPPARTAYYRTLALVVDQTGDVLHLLGRDVEACEYYRRLLETPELASVLEDSYYLNANRFLADAALRANEPAALSQYNEAIERILAKGELPPDLIVSLRIDGIVRLYPDVSDLRRIKALERLWQDPQFQASDAILRAGDLLDLAYYSTEPRRSQDVLRIGLVLLERLQPRIQATQQETSRNWSAMYIRNALMVLDCGWAGLDAKRIQEIKSQFEVVVGEHPVEIRVPTSGSSQQAIQRAARLFESYQRHFPEHYRRHGANTQ